VELLAVTTAMFGWELNALTTTTIWIQQFGFKGIWIQQFEFKDAKNKLTNKSTIWQSDSSG